jgi:hypothetical protein
MKDEMRGGLFSISLVAFVPVRSRFLAKPATLLHLINFPFFSGVRDYYSVLKWLRFLSLCKEWLLMPVYISILKFV